MLTGPAIAPQSGDKADSLVIFLHGYGANGQDLLGIGYEWQRHLPNTAFVSPNAPEPCEANPFFGFQWFPIRVADGIVTDAFTREEVAKTPAVALNAYIDEQIKTWGVPANRVVVIGFSQGAMMAMYTMPRRAEPCAGVIGYSGLLVHAEGLKKPGISKMPILAIHGNMDPIVPPYMLQGVDEGFNAAGFQVETIMRPGLAHGIDPFGLDRGLSFVKEVLQIS